MAAQLDEAAVDVPEDMPLYDTQTDFPWHFQPHAPYADMLARVAEAAPQMLQLLDAPDHPLPYPGAQHILRWETTMVRNLSCWQCEKSGVALTQSDDICSHACLGTR